MKTRLIQIYADYTNEWWSARIETQHADRTVVFQVLSDGDRIVFRPLHDKTIRVYRSWPNKFNGAVVPVFRHVVGLWAYQQYGK